MTSGSAVIASTIVRVGRAILPPTSARNVAASRPSGTANSVPRPICSSVPMIACSTPPTDSGESGEAKAIDWVHMFRCNAACRPLAMTKSTWPSTMLTARTPPVVKATRATLWLTSRASHCIRAMAAYMSRNTPYHITQKPSTPENGRTRS